MPELPEVETTRRGIAPHIQALTISEVVVRQPQLRWLVSPALQDLKACAIAAVSRRGKYLIMATERGDIIVHLGMSGSLRICQADEPPMAHDHVDICFSNGTALRLRDPRRFGAVLFAEDALAHTLLASLGPEPLADSFDGRLLYERSRGKSRNVKKHIMDSKVVVGVGNIYANEALFMAGIRPTANCGRISLARYDKLAEAIKQVLAKAIDAGGTTLKDFVNGDGQPGYFKNELLVYGRENQACVQCGLALTLIRIDNRATVFCKHCQR